MPVSDRAAEASPLLTTPPKDNNEQDPFFPPAPPPHESELAEHPQRTTQKRSELGFYLFSIASEIWVITTGTLFLPVVLETYARSNGRLGPDYASPCPPSGQLTQGGPERAIVARCAVKIFFTWIDTASFSLMIYSTSVALQALTVISIGALADDARLRHRLLLSFATIGSLASIAFLLVPSASIFWPLCALLAIGSNVSFGATGVCLNSYLPSLVRLSSEIADAEQTFESALTTYRERLHSEQSISASTLPTLPPARPDPQEGCSFEPLDEAFADLSRSTSLYTSLKSQETSRISSRAIALGYAAGISVLVLLMLPVVSLLTTSGTQEGGSDPTWSLRVAIAISGVLWISGSMLASTYLKPSPEGNQLEPPSQRKGVRWSESVQKSWTELGNTLKEWRKLPNTFVFLSAWFLLSDSFATLTSTAMLFAKTTLNLPTSSLIAIAILTPLSGIFGSLLFPHLQSRQYLPSSNLSLLIVLVVLSTSIPIWGLVSLTSSVQLYVLSIVFGTLYGSFQSYSRTCFSQLIPKSQSGRWFGLYSITDKSSSFLGPLLVSIVTNQTGEIRHGFYLILAFFTLSIPILCQVHLDEGTNDADEFEKGLGRTGESPPSS